MPVVPIDFQDGVNDFDVGVDESIFFSLYAEWRIWMPKSVIGGFHQSRETQITIVKWTNVGGQTKQVACEQAFGRAGN